MRLSRPFLLNRNSPSLAKIAKIAIRMKITSSQIQEKQEKKRAQETKCFSKITRCGLHSKKL
jgi:hypothetical protein